jgi:gliding motility-associated-like protein
VKIGEVRRDLQLLVIDCPTTALSTPIIQIQNQPVGTTEALLCAGKPVVLQTTANADWTYQWDKNGIPVNGATTSGLTVLEPGEYIVTVTLVTGCSQRLRSGSVRINDASASTSVTFDSIPNLCGTDHPLVQLKGSPAGGVFSGKGIEGDLFRPDLAGVGTHELTYTIQPASNQCYSGTARRRAVVGSAPTVGLPTELTIDKGGSVDLQPTLTGQPVRFLWEPAIYLTASDRPGVRAVNVDTDVLYTLTATDQAGCRGMDSVRVRVHQHLWVPDAFSPNGDGLNDTWQLTGIEAYPQARLTVYNRWGQAVYQSVGYDRPFDGTDSGKSLPTGAYSYVLHPAPNSPSVKGSVLLVR